MLEDITVRADDNEYILAICITTQRLLLFQDINRILFRVAPITLNGYRPKYEMIFELDKKKIEKFRYEHGMNYLKIDNNHILELYCENLKEYLLKI